MTDTKPAEGTETPEAKAPAKAKAETEEGRYAVYDETLLRFIGRVHNTKAEATKAAKDGPKGHTLKVRKV